MEKYIIALIGVAGAVIGALISGFFQLIITRKSINNTKNQFQIQIEHSRTELTSKLDQMREEQKRISIEKASKNFGAANNRFYSNLLREMRFYGRLLNELHYLNNLSHPSGKQRRINSGIYPHIANTIGDMVGDIDLHQNIAEMLGRLRCNIDEYNAALATHVDSEILEELLLRIYEIIGPINEERFKNYNSVQALLREHEVTAGEEQLQLQQ